MYTLESKTIQHSDGTSCQKLVISGALGIAGIRHLKEDLLAALNGHAHVVLDMSAVTDLDYSVFQLLCSANKYAQQHGRHFQLQGQCTEPLIDRAQSLGFLRDHACSKVKDPDKCLWIPKNLN